MWNMMTRLVGWAAPIVPRTNQQDDPLSDWQWVLSNAEEISKRQSETHKAEIQKEVETLRKLGNSVSYKSMLQQAISLHWTALYPDDILAVESLSLDPSKRDKIIRDIVRSVSNKWLESLCKNFALNESFSASWHQEKYKKNTIGEISSFAFTASNTGVYNERTCRDIIWAVYICMGKSIVNNLQRELTSHEQDFILSLALMILPCLSNLWIETVKNAGTIAKREGTLPKLWKKQEEEKEKSLKELKDSGKVTARYNDGPDDLLRKDILSKSIMQPSKTTLKDKKDFLSQSLMMRRPK